MLSERKPLALELKKTDMGDTKDFRALLIPKNNVFVEPQWYRGSLTPGEDAVYDLIGEQNGDELFIPYKELYNLYFVIETEVGGRKTIVDDEIISKIDALHKLRYDIIVSSVQGVAKKYSDPRGVANSAVAIADEVCTKILNQSK